MAIAYRVPLTQEQKEALSKMSIGEAETFFEILGIRFVIENGKVVGVEI